MAVIPAKAEVLYNSAAGQSSLNMRPKDTKQMLRCFARHVETGLTSCAVVKHLGLRRNDGK
jgi:hypothetical protein